MPREGLNARGAVNPTTGNELGTSSQLEEKFVVVSDPHGG